MDDFTLVFYVTISVVSFFSVAASLWIVYKCRIIDFGYAGLELSSAEILRHHVYWLAVSNALYSLHYFKIIFIFLDQDQLFESGIGKSFCIIIAIYTEFCLIATLTWYFFICVLLLYTFYVEREPESSEKLLRAQRGAVIALSTTFVVLPIVINGDIESAYGPDNLQHLDVVVCDIQGPGEIPHDILVTGMVIFSIISLIIVLYLSRNVLKASRRRGKEFFSFLWKRVSFTTAFVVTYMWRPLLMISGGENRALWFIGNVYIASSGICYFLMWFLQIQHHAHEVEALFEERKNTTSQFIFKKSIRQPKIAHSAKSSIDSLGSLEYYALGSDCSSPDFGSVRKDFLFSVNSGSPKPISILEDPNDPDMMSVPTIANISSVQSSMYSQSSAGIRIVTTVSDITREDSLTFGGENFEEDQYSVPSRSMIGMSHTSNVSFGKIDSLLLEEDYSPSNSVERKFHKREPSTKSDESFGAVELHDDVPRFHIKNVTIQ